jgi:hypothetical protein
MKRSLGADASNNTRGCTYLAGVKRPARSIEKELEAIIRAAQTTARILFSQRTLPKACNVND